MKSESYNFCFIPDVKIQLASFTYSVKYCLFCVTYFPKILFNVVFLCIHWYLQETAILKAFAFLHFQHATLKIMQCAYKIC